MRRAVLLLAAVLLLPGATAQARTVKAKPKTSVTLTQVAPSTPRKPAKVLVHVEASDADGHITELAIDTGNGVLISMLLACDPEEPNGTAAVQELTWDYAPGTYTVTAWAYSSPDCFSGPFEQSRPGRATIVVT